jgi:DNA polymerase-3 subunit epsilon
MTGDFPFDTDRPAICFDLEATGKDPSEARIIQIGAVKYAEDGTPIESVNKLVDPRSPIPNHVVQLTGITNASVHGAPAFAEIASDVEKFFSGCHLIGYNSKTYDLPLLKAEMNRAGLTFPEDESRVHVDIYKKEKDLQSRSLEDVYFKYAREELTEAHQAHADVSATLEIAAGQMDFYDCESDIAAFATDSGDYLDSKERLKEAGDGTLLVCFGKHAGDGPIPFRDLAQKDRQYALWIWEEIAELRPYIREECERLGLIEP